MRTFLFYLRTLFFLFITCGLCAARYQACGLFCFALRPRWQRALAPGQRAHSFLFLIKVIWILLSISVYLGSLESISLYDRSTNSQSFISQHLNQVFKWYCQFGACGVPLCLSSVFSHAWTKISLSNSMQPSWCGLWLVPQLSLVHLWGVRFLKINCLIDKALISSAYLGIMLPSFALNYTRDTFLLTLFS